jgi:hypothetical protein
MRSRYARYIGLACTHLQETASAAVINLTRIFNWLVTEGSVSSNFDRSLGCGLLSPSDLHTRLPAWHHRRDPISSRLPSGAGRSARPPTYWNLHALRPLRKLYSREDDTTLCFQPATGGYSPTLLTKQLFSTNLAASFKKTNKFRK